MLKKKTQDKEKNKIKKEPIQFKGSSHRSLWSPAGDRSLEHYERSKSPHERGLF